MAPQEIPQSILDRYQRVSVATVYTALGINRGIRCFMEGVQPMTPGKRMAARARTLRCLPPRPDFYEEVTQGEDSPEYRAMALCGPGDALVVDFMRLPYATDLGDVKLLQLRMQGADGFVTDGAIRDLDVIATYGFAVFAQRRTPTALEYGKAYEENVPIQCAGVLVKPGDLIAADDDGVVVVPAALAEEVIEWVEEHEEAEEHVKRQILETRARPGRFYPPTDELKEELRRSRSSGS